MWVFALLHKSELEQKQGDTVMWNHEEHGAMNNGLDLEYKNKTTFQAILKRTIFICFILINVNWGCVEERNQIRENQLEFQFSDEGQKLITDLKELEKEASAKAKAGTLTPEETAQVQLEIVNACSKTGTDWTKRTYRIITLGRDSFIRNWKPSNKEEKMASDRFGFNSEGKASYAYGLFNKRLMDYRNSHPPENYTPIRKEDLVTIFLGFLRWYFLLMIPSFVLLLINFKYDEIAIKEELILNWSGVLGRILIWPIGIITDLNGPIRFRKYQELEFAFAYQKGGHWYITKEEKDALWLQVLQPVLQFDQAMEIVQSSSAHVRRPVTVCCIAWMIGILANHSKPIETVRKACVVSVQTFLENSDETKKGGESSSSLDLLAEVPTDTLWFEDEPMPSFVLNAWKRVVHMFVPYAPRGPPTASNREILNNLFWLSQPRRER